MANYCRAVTKSLRGTAGIRLKYQLFLNDGKGTHGDSFANKSFVSLCQLSWQRLHMVPGGDELMGAPLENDSHLRAVRRNTPYETEEQYMDTYYRLLRADCFAAIQKVGIL
jgi:hypothetical protein